MISISCQDIEDFKPINSGSFGSVYYIDEETAYKIYHSKIPNIMGVYIDNPVLSFSLNRLHRLRERTKVLKYTQSIQDVIYVNGKFGGIVIPYFEGEKLDHYLDSSFQVKMDYSKQLIRNHKELHHHFIFPRDYKLNNIIVSHSSIKIIDLDDFLTSLPSVVLPHHVLSSNYSFSKCISMFFQEYPSSQSLSEVSSYYNGEKLNPTVSLPHLEIILNKKRKPHHFQILDFSTLESIRKTNHQLLYLYDGNISDEEMSFVLHRLKEKNISLFDFVDRNHLLKYYNHYNTEICMDSEEHVIYQKNK